MIAAFKLTVVILLPERIKIYQEVIDRPHHKSLSHVLDFGNILTPNLPKRVCHVSHCCWKLANFWSLQGPLQQPWTKTYTSVTPSNRRPQIRAGNTENDSSPPAFDDPWVEGEWWISSLWKSLYTRLKAAILCARGHMETSQREGTRPKKPRVTILRHRCHSSILLL